MENEIKKPADVEGERLGVARPSSVTEAQHKLKTVDHCGCQKVALNQYLDETYPIINK
jgi:hypothetical protein